MQCSSPSWPTFLRLGDSTDGFSFWGRLCFRVCSGYKFSLLMSCKAEGLGWSLELLKQRRLVPGSEVTSWDIGLCVGFFFFLKKKKSEQRGMQGHGGSPETGSCCLTGRIRNISLRSLESGVCLTCLAMSVLQDRLARCGRWFPEGLTVGELRVSRVSSTLFYKALEEQYQGVETSVCYHYK